MQWLEQNADAVGLDAAHRTPKTYIPREIYSQYLKSTLRNEAAESKKVEFHKVSDEAVDARVLPDSTIQVRM